jgi:hypothetical protein
MCIHKLTCSFTPYTRCSWAGYLAHGASTGSTRLGICIYPPPQLPPLDLEPSLILSLLSSLSRSGSPSFALLDCSPSKAYVSEPVSVDESDASVTGALCPLWRAMPLSRVVSVTLILDLVALVSVSPLVASFPC